MSSSVFTGSRTDEVLRVPRQLQSLLKASRPLLSLTSKPKDYGKGDYSIHQYPGWRRRRASRRNASTLVVASTPTPTSTITGLQLGSWLWMSLYGDGSDCGTNVVGSATRSLAITGSKDATPINFSRATACATCRSSLFDTLRRFDNTAHPIGTALTASPMAPRPTTNTCPYLFSDFRTTSHTTTRTTTQKATFNVAYVVLLSGRWFRSSHRDPRLLAYN
jgi:hypothetical protein